MASGSFEFTASGYLQGKIDWSSSSNGSTANSSNVTAILYARRTNGYTTSGSTWSGYVKIGSTQKNIGFSSSVSVSSSWVEMARVTATVGHNSNGTGSVNVAGSVTGPSGTALSGNTSSGNQTVTLDTIPRYAYITSISLASRTCNSLTFNYTADKSCTIYVRNETDGTDWLNNGNPFVSNKSSGSFTINFADRGNSTRLTPNKAYSFTVLCRATDSGLDTSKTVSGTTFDIAKLSSVPNVNIGSSHTISWTNPSGASTSLKLCKTDNSQIINYGTVTGTSKSITPTANTIYALTPNSNTYTARYIITTTVNNQSYTNYKDFIFSVINSNPTFSNFTYEDTNSSIIALTGNNQILVKGYSNPRATISTANKAVAKNSATMKTYKYVQGSKNASANYSSSADVNLSLSAIDSNVMTMTATDSRGNSTTVTKTLNSTNYKDYSPVVIGTAVAVRGSNGVGQDVALAFSGTYWNGNFGSIANDIVSATYQYKESSSNTWSTATALTVTKSGSNFIFSGAIQGNLGANGFSVEKSFDIKVTITDKLVTKTYTTTLGSGTPALAIYKDKVAIGQKYNTNVGGALQVNGSTKIKGTASDKPLMVRGIVGSTADNSAVEGLYLQYGVNQPVYFGNGGGYSISADGSYYNGKANTANSATSASYASRVSSRGNITAETGTTKPGLAGISMQNAYNNGYPNTYGNVLSLYGGGASQIFLGWEGSTVRGRAYYRSIRDVSSNWSSWGRFHVSEGLYDNSSGTNGTVTLSANASNFDWLEVFLKNTDDGYVTSVKIYAPHGKQFNVFSNTFNSSQSEFFMTTKRYNISGTSITVAVNNAITSIKGTAVKSAPTTYNNVNIIRVDGYR